MSVPVRKELTVKASQARAFEVFTSGMSRWWPATHTILTAPLKETVLEGRVGGRWYVVGTDGSRCDTGHVLEWSPPDRVVLAWQINADWQFDPELITEVEVQFVAEGDMTRVTLEHHNLHRMGVKSEQARLAVDSPNGWSAILSAYQKVVEA
jgi:uncharacterized protein YndB with AHSA1/START domain